VVKQSFFGLPGQYGRRVTKANWSNGEFLFSIGKNAAFRWSVASLARLKNIAVAEGSHKRLSIRSIRSFDRFDQFDRFVVDRIDRINLHNGGQAAFLLLLYFFSVAFAHHYSWLSKSSYKD